jgi:hypothetical protein
VERACGHEHEAVDTGDDPRDRLDRFRTLHREQCLVFEDVDRDVVGEMLDQVADVVILGRAVDDDVEAAARGRRRVKRVVCLGLDVLRGERRWLVVGQARGHQIVEDTAVLREQQRIAHLALAEPGDVARQHGFECVRDAFAGEDELAHVTDVEQPGRVARPGVFGHDAFILDRHLVAGELDHPRAVRAVPCVERQWQDLGLDVIVGLIDDAGVIAQSGIAHARLRRRGARHPVVLRSEPPLSRDLRAFARTKSSAYPFGGPRRERQDAFQSVDQPRAVSGA